MTAPGGGSDTRTATVDLNANVGDYSQQMNAATASTNQTASAVDKLDSKLSGLTKYAGKKLLNFSRDDFAVLTGATADAATFQKQLSSLAATASITGSSFSGIKSGIESAFEKFPTARGEIVALAESISDLGVTAPRDITSLITTFIKLGAATGEGIQPLATGLIQLSRLMGTTDATQIGNYANSLLTVSKNSGVSATGVLSFAQSIAPMARQAGIGEAAVLGISAAFSKAGADGYVAANTFNSMVSDITSLTSSGSPELAKYANLIGVTVNQFKSMDKTTALTDIFNTISKQGPAAVNTLNRLGIDGTRAQAAIAAVVQSGGLQGAIASATGSSTNQANLTKGSASALNNVADGLARLRNEFTEFGTMIGTTFLTPLGKMIEILDGALSKLNDFIRPFTPILAVLAAVAGAMAAVGGAALTMASIIGTVGLAKLAISSGPIRALREGIGAGTGAKTGTATEAMYAADTVYRKGMPGTGQKYNTETGERLGKKMPLRTRIPYEAGFGGAQVLGGTVLGGGASGTARDADPSGFAQARRYVLRAPLMGATALTHASTKMSADEAKPDAYTRSAYTSVGGGGTFKSSFASSVAANRTNTAEMTSTEAVIAELKRFAMALLEAGVQVTKTGASLFTKSGWAAGGANVGSTKFASAGFMDEEGNAIPHAMGSAPRFGAVRAAGGAALGAAKGVGSAAMGLMGGPVGLGLMGAVGGYEAYSALQNKTKEQDAVTSQNLDPLSKLNDQIGVTTTTMSNFNNAVGNAANTLAGKIPANVTVAQATTESSQDQSTFSNTKVTDKTVAAMYKHGAKSGVKAQGQITALAQSYNMTDPKTVEAFKAQLIAAGYSKDDINAGLKPLNGPNNTVAGGTPNYVNLANQVAKTENVGMQWTNNQSTTGGLINASALTSLNVQQQNNQNTHSLGYSNVKELQDSTTYLGQMAKNAINNPEASKAYATALATLTGGKQSDFTKNFVNGAYTGGTDMQSQLKMLGSDKLGKQYLNARAQGGLTPALDSAINKGTATPAQIQAYLAANVSAPSDSTEATTVAGVTGPTIGNNKGVAIGKFANANSTVQNAINNPGDANAQTAGATALYTQMKGAGSSFADISQAMDNFKGAIKDTTDPLYMMAEAAKQVAAADDQYAQQGMSQEGKLTDTAANYQQARTNAAANPNDPDAQADLATQKTNYQTALTNYAQFQQTMESSAISYGTQMSRAAEDQNTSIQRSNLAFYIQQTQAAQDYQRQNMISVRDYNIQMERQAQSAAESIYNPYQRVNAETTVSAASLVENLQNQNQKIQQQYTQLQQLQSMGVSQNSIDTLQLSDPNNAQQLNSIVQGIMNDPSLVAQINQAVGTRVAATTQLTQSTFSETFRNTTADFNTQLSDTATAYDIQKQRAIDSQSLSLSQMAEDYNKMVTRSAADLAQSFVQIYGDYGTSYTNALAAINTDIGKYSPEIAKQLTSELTTMQTSINSVGLPGSTAGGVTPAGTKGLNSQGVYGSYNAQGVFVPIQTVMSNQEKANLPLISPPLGHAAGGISTFAHVANISEGNSTEAIIPLDQRGAAFMAGFAQQVSMNLLKQMNTAQYGVQPTGVNAGSGSTSYSVDQSLNLGTVNITANNTKEIQAELAKARRFKALSQPPSATASTLGAG